MVDDSEELANLEETGGEPNPAQYNISRVNHSAKSIDYANAIASSLKVKKYIEQETGRTITKLTAKRTDFIHNIIYLNGKKFDFTGRGYLFPIYNNNWKSILLMTGRQVEKSTMVCNRIVSDSTVIPYYKCLYVSPSHMQTRQFSSDRLKPARDQSPLISKYFISHSTSDHVFEKGYTNGSMNFLRSAFHNADRTRGLSADLLCLDELQDLIMSNIPVIEEVLSHSKHGYKLYTGTPKTFDNTIQQFWERSTQSEWLVPCERHSPLHWNFLDERAIGKHGPICNKCGNKIYPQNGKWFSTSSKNEFYGFRISQIMVPWYSEIEDKWQDLIRKLETYPKSQFYNECLGLSYDSATKPISKGEIMQCCKEEYPIFYEPTAAIRGYQCFAGVDWGEGTDGSEKNANGKFKNASYTVLTIGTYIGEKFFPFYARRFTGAECSPSFIEKEIIRTCRMFNVIQIGVDWGHGWGMNDRIEQAFGRNRVIRFMHVGSLRQRRKYDPVAHRYQISRNQVITEVFEDIKRKNIIFPRWSEFETFAQDLMNVYSEYNEYSRTIRYDHRADQPDDYLHALIYCREAANIYFGIDRMVSVT